MTREEKFPIRKAFAMLICECAMLEVTEKKKYEIYDLICATQEEVENLMNKF